MEHMLRHGLDKEPLPEAHALRPHPRHQNLRGAGCYS